MSTRHRILLTNDDGIDCVFLHELAAALATRHRVFVAAPAGERSWIGRAFSRNGEVSVAAEGMPDAEQAWRIRRTPSDCVNIALGHLLTGDNAPDIVLSGINIGYNASMPLGLSSGTMAGAIEGAAWGGRAAAFSLHLDQSDFEYLRHHRGQASGNTLKALRSAAGHALKFTNELLMQPKQAGRIEIHNFNFPRDCDDDCAVEEVEPAHLRLGSLFEQVKPGVFRFVWNDGLDLSGHNRTDLAGLARGNICRSTIDFSTLGRLPGIR